MRIEIDDLSRPEVRELLNEHLTSMDELLPPQSVHTLDLTALREPNITFWTAWDDTVLLGCAALKELDPSHGEIKSMRTPQALRRRGAGRALLTHIIDVAKSRGYKRLSLETGSMDSFIPAHKLYESFGFTYCGPFGDYQDDPNSVFMFLNLRTQLVASPVVPGYLQSHVRDNTMVVSAISRTVGRALHRVSEAVMAPICGQSKLSG